MASRLLHCSFKAYTCFDFRLGMNVLYLAHCVPNPPNKGEKIRAYQEIKGLTRNHNVHLACFARAKDELKFAEQLKDYCASVYAEVLSVPRALTHAAFQFAFGGSINLAFYESQRMRRYVSELSDRIHFDAAVAYTLPMASHVPPSIPCLLDMVDVDSEKWFQYARMRIVGLPYGIEAQRLRRIEALYAQRAATTILTTEPEVALLQSFASSRQIASIENGVDWDVFDPALIRIPPELRVRRYLAFVGTMDYYPNIDAVRWFATRVFPELRKRVADLEFLIVGNRPSRTIRTLKCIPGVTITGGVPDVRPYVLGSQAVVAPLRIARGIQNKVLEAMALGRHTFASTEVCKTFGREVPASVIPCKSAPVYIAKITAALERNAQPSPRVPTEMRARFSWSANIDRFLSLLENVGESKCARPEVPAAAV